MGLCGSVVLQEKLSVTARRRIGMLIFGALSLYGVAFGVFMLTRLLLTEIEAGFVEVILVGTSSYLFLWFGFTITRMMIRAGLSAYAEDLV